MRLARLITTMSLFILVMLANISVVWMKDLDILQLCHPSTHAHIHTHSHTLTHIHAQAEQLILWHTFSELQVLLRVDFIQTASVRKENMIRTLYERGELRPQVSRIQVSSAWHYVWRRAIVGRLMSCGMNCLY